jgi:acyl-CoA synthetase (AMP-forming)/AMP-acid ligase II
MEMRNIGDLLILNAGRYPDCTALVHKTERFSYRELNQQVNRMAHHLLSLGIQKGDRVGFMFFNSVQIVQIFFATQKIGALAVPVNFRLIPKEVKFILDHSRCKAFAYGEACSSQVDPVKKEFSTVEQLIFSGRNCPVGEHHFETFTGSGCTEEPGVIVEEEDRSVILYTGGTTGVPKGAVYSHRSFLWLNLSGLIRTNATDPDHVKLMQLPLFHMNGLSSLTQSIAVGGKFVIVDAFDPQEMLRLIETERVTYIFLLPAESYFRLLDVPNIKDFDLASITFLGLAVGVFSKTLMLKLFDTFPNGNISWGWGSTESGCGIFGSISRELVEQDSERLFSLGKEMPFLSVRLVDDEGKDVPVGEIGEAIVQGPMTFREYFDQPEQTAQTIRNGWTHTGDLLRKDEDGYYYFVDRKKDMIKTGGENVFAVEVEGAISKHPSVEQCAVIGVPDPRFGEGIMAVVKLRPGMSATEEEIIEHCRQHLASYKKPRKVAFVESFPMASGIKIQKFKLREMFSKATG